MTPDDLKWLDEAMEWWLGPYTSDRAGKATPEHRVGLLARDERQSAMHRRIARLIAYDCPECGIERASKRGRCPHCKAKPTRIG